MKMTPLASLTLHFLLQFYFSPRFKVRDTISIPLKNPIIVPTLDPPPPSSTPSHTGTKTSLFLARQPSQAQPLYGM